MKRIALPAAVALAVFVSACPGLSQAAANLVTNGSFESGAGGIGSFDGWQTVLGDAATFVDSSGQTGTQYGQASDGLWSAYFGSSAASGGATISQTLATTAGQTYWVSFDLANDNGGAPASNALSATAGAQSLLHVSGLPAQGYVHEVFQFTGTGPTTTLSFSVFNDAGYTQLDNVAVAAVPEPATSVLALFGLLAGGPLVRRLRSRRG